MHLQALAAAAAGGPNEFGVELTGRADVNRLALFGHSRGGEAALVSANSPEMLTASRGYGPVAGVLLIAAATVTADPWLGSAVPLATILAACDGDVTTQDGQFFYEGARLAPQQSQWATSVWLERANHNHFNQILGRDPFRPPGSARLRYDLGGGDTARWLADYAVDFLTALFAPGPGSGARRPEARMGMDVRLPAPDELYGLPARVAGPGAGSRPADVMIPAAAEELTTNLLGGQVTAKGVATHFCPKGFYSRQ